MAGSERGSGHAIVPLRQHIADIARDTVDRVIFGDMEHVREKRSASTEEASTCINGRKGPDLNVTDGGQYRKRWRDGLVDGL